MMIIHEYQVKYLQKHKAQGLMLSDGWLFILFHTTK